jgi:hypothetical protein
MEIAELTKKELAANGRSLLMRSHRGFQSLALGLVICNAAHAGKRPAELVCGELLIFDTNQQFATHRIKFRVIRVCMRRYY